MDINVIIHQMIILFILMGLGYLLNKVHILGPKIDKGITGLILYCTMPAMILGAVLTQEDERDVKLAVSCLIAAAVMYMVLPFIAKLLVWILRVKPGSKGIYEFMIIFGNVGFMGFPIIAALFGQESVVYGSIFNIFFNLLVYSYGIIIVMKDLEERQKTEGGNDAAAPVEKFHFSWKKLLTPGISVAVLALIIFFLDIELPDVIVSPVASLGNITSPLAMLIIGSTLANMDIREVFNDVRVYVFVAVRFFLLPLVLFPVLKLIIHDSFLLQLTVIMLLMPVANTSVLYAKQYGSDENLAAKSIFISTLLSIVTIPLVAYICF